MMASSSSATDVEASCFYAARVGECDSSAVDGVAVEETKSVPAEAGPTAVRSAYFNARHAYFNARHESMMESTDYVPDDGVAREIEFVKVHMSEVTRTEVAPLWPVAEAQDREIREISRELESEVAPSAGPTGASSELESRDEFPDDGDAREIEFPMDWSDCSEVAPLSAYEEALKRDNMEVLQELEREHGGRRSILNGQWEYLPLFDIKYERQWKGGGMIAQGGQAKIYEIQGHSRYLLKVFESGTSLRQLSKMWPLPVVKGEVPHCIRGGRILEDGRFAFLMDRHWGDLRKLIDLAMQERKAIDGIYGPPFPYRWNEFAIRFEDIMHMIAMQMMVLHEAGVFHRDLKASNILLRSPSKNMFLDSNYLITVADFECSIGVLGTGYWRAPEVLSAIVKHEGIMDTQWEKADVYSFGMLYFEVVTGRIPFDDELKNYRNDYAFVIKGRRPRLPSDLDGEVKNLISKCWDPNPNMRPTFREIVQLCEAITLKQCQFKLFGIEDEIPLPYHLTTKEEVFDYPMALSRSILEVPKSYVQRICLHLADGSIDIPRFWTSRKIFNYKVARLC